MAFEAAQTVPKGPEAVDPGLPQFTVPEGAASAKSASPPSNPGESAPLLEKFFTEILPAGIAKLSSMVASAAETAASAVGDVTESVSQSIRFSGAGLSANAPAVQLAPVEPITPQLAVEPSISQSQPEAGDKFAELLKGEKISCMGAGYDSQHCGMENKAPMQVASALPARAESLAM